VDSWRLIPEACSLLEAQQKLDNVPARKTYALCKAKKQIGVGNLASYYASKLLDVCCEGQNLLRFSEDTVKCPRRWGHERLILYDSR
jgi:hypothetical protein